MKFGYIFPMKLIGLGLLALVFVGCAGQPRATERPQERFEGGSCQLLSNWDRRAIMQVANPRRFPSTRYRKGPNPRVSPRVETDCSHFVHYVYRAAGLPYRFRSTEEMLDAPEFEQIDPDEAKPGDLLVMRGHMGLLDENGKLISATLTHRRRTPTSITRYSVDNFRKIRGKRYVLRYRCRPNMQTTSR